ncbi:hypothetical protein [uncultured Aquimarina sp.]|uniref:hypothetical protein n=1 Tax=uncultured Aquimarina sp. TaxID=575652 RepID=UPI002605C1E7|nr:hypothetical protein [uncultured Aquimarina sp.]
MRKCFIISITMFFCCFFSCNPNSDKEINQSAGAKTLRLNNGKKWKATGSMINGMDKMNAILEGLDMESFDQKMIGYKLNFEIRMMMSMCTATGEAHNQFHYYLDPLKEQVNGLQIVNDMSKEPLLKAIKSHLDAYNDYFN